MKTGIENVNRHACVPVKLYIQKQATGHIYTAGHSLPTLNVDIYEVVWEPWNPRTLNITFIHKCIPLLN